MNKALRLILDRIQKLKIFQRNKKSLRIKVTSSLIYTAISSYRTTAYLAEFLEGVGVSHEAVRLWVLKLKHILSRIVTYEKKKRGVIAVDETKLKMHGRHIYIYAAIDVKTKEILGISACVGRTYLDTLTFMKKVLKTCENKPLVLVDHAPWYPWALQRLGLKYEQITFSERNKIERWFRTLKQRTRRFYNNFSTKNIMEIERFLELYAFWYNCLRYHMTLKKSPMEVSHVLT
jgi:transposase-like protein